MSQSPAACLEQAIRTREGLIERLLAEGTDAFRLLHGVAEGWPGLAVDRYGSLALIQSFREGLEPTRLEGLQTVLRRHFPELEPVYRDRSAGVHVTEPPSEQDAPSLCHEFGRSFLVRARHRGLDPYLFLDLRAGRRLLRDFQGSMLNLFAYTCSAGVHAAAEGGQALNVDFSRAHLEIGRQNARLNGIPRERFETLCEDALPVLRQLAGLPVKGRAARRPYTRVEARQFDLVFLDPPTRAVSPFGAVDLIRDYPALAKPGMMATRPGGRLLATNHVGEVPLEDWLAVLRRTGEKCGRPVQDMQVIPVEEDFPSPDGRPALKIALLQM